MGGPLLGPGSDQLHPELLIVKEKDAMNRCDCKGEGSQICFSVVMTLYSSDGSTGSEKRGRRKHIGNLSGMNFTLEKNQIF